MVSGSSTITSDHSSRKTGLFQFVGGTGGTAGFQFFTSDAGANQILTERLRIQHDGNIGIGTASPSYKLDVAGGVKIGGEETLPSAIGSMYLSYNSAINRIYYGDGTGYDLRFSKRGASATTDFVTFKDTGYVGIGTTAPAAKLEIAHDGASTYGTALHIKTTAGTDGPRAAFEYYNGGSPKRWNVGIRNSATSFGIFEDGSYGAFGTERLTILAGGNVGIGTTAPTAKLFIVGSTGAPDNTLDLVTNTFTTSSAGSMLRIGHVASSGNTVAQIDNLYNGATTFGNLALQSGGGNVGIGTTSPVAKLQVELTGTVSLATATIVKSTDFAANARVGFNGLVNNSDGIFFGMGANGTGIPAGMGFFREASGWNTALAFYTNNVTSGPNSTSAMQEKMRITSAGNVGIGQASPSYKLEVETGSSDADGIRVRDSAVGVWTDIRRRYIECTGADFWINSQSSSFDLRTANSSKLFITLSGNVGIGTTVPNQKFEVTGGAIIASGFGNRPAGTGKALEIGMDGTQGVLQAYDRSFSTHIPLAISASTTTFSGAVTSTGTLTTSSGRVVATSIKTTTYTLATTDHVIVCNHASTPFTVTLIAASANTGRVFVVKNKGVATVTLSATGLGTIDGQNTRALAANQSLTLCSDGVQWNII